MKGFALISVILISFVNSQGYYNVPNCQTSGYSNYGQDQSQLFMVPAGQSCQLSFPSGPGSLKVSEVQLSITYGPPIQANAVDCPLGTTTSCNSQNLQSALKYTFKDPLMNATTNNVIVPHTVTVILSNFDGDD